MMIDKVQRVTTSIKVDPDVWKKAKIEAINQDMELSELVERALEKWFREQRELRR